MQKIESCDIIEFPDNFELLYELLSSTNLYFTQKIPKILVRMTESRTNYYFSEMSLKAVIYKKYRKFTGYEDILIYLMELYALLKADKLVCSSRSMVKFFKNFYSLEFSRFAIIPLPLEEIVFPFSSVSSELKFDDIKKSMNYLVYEDLNPLKGTDIVIRASLIWMEKYNINARFFFVGKNNFEFVKELIPEKYVNNYIFVDNSDKEMIKELSKKMRCAIFASRYEAIGIKPLIIYELGLPLVISNITIFREYFSEENSFLFEENNITSLVYILNEIITNENKLRNLVNQKKIWKNNNKVGENYQKLNQFLDIIPDNNYQKIKIDKDQEIKKLISEILKKRNTDIQPFYD